MSEGNGASGTQVEQKFEPTASGSGFQREEVDASVRGTAYADGPDLRGVAAASETAARLVERFGPRVREWKNWRDEVTVVVDVAALVEISTWLRDDEGYALLSDLSPCDWLDRKPTRFSVSYHVTRLAPGAPRLRVQVWVDEGQGIPSVMGVWPTADWHEREAYDFFGIEFTGRAGLRRLIMPDEWEGHPLRKDYPLGGEPVKFTNSLREL